MAVKTKKDAIAYIIDTVPIIKKPKSVAFVYNIGKDKINHLVSDLEKDENNIVVSCLDYNQSLQIVSRIADDLGAKPKDKKAVKMNLVEEKIFSGDKLIVFQHAEYLQMVLSPGDALKLIEEFHKKGAALLFISSHVGFERVFKSWDLYNKYLAVTYDFKTL